MSWQNLRSKNTHTKLGINKKFREKLGNLEMGQKKLGKTMIVDNVIRTCASTHSWLLESASVRLPRSRHTLDDVVDTEDHLGSL